MNIVSGEMVKLSVASDLKKRKINQISIAEITGLTRQTVAAILASPDYFSEKHAAIFSLAFGYNRLFLRTGKGPLISETSDYGKTIVIDYQGKFLDILKKATSISATVNAIVIRHGSEACMDLLKKLQVMYNFIDTLKYYPPLRINGIEQPPHDPEMMDAAVKIFSPVYDELTKIILEKYANGVEVDYLDNKD